MPVFAISKMNGNLADILAGALDNELQAYLVAYRVKLLSLLKDSSRQSKETGHGVLYRSKRPGQECCHLAVYPTKETPCLICAGARNVTAPQSEIAIPIFNTFEQARYGLRGMTQVRIHANQIVSLCLSKSMNDSRTESSYAKSSDDSNRISFISQLFHYLFATILAIVINNNNLKGPVKW